MKRQVIALALICTVLQFSVFAAFANERISASQSLNRYERLTVGPSGSPFLIPQQSWLSKEPTPFLSKSEMMFGQDIIESIYETRNSNAEVRIRGVVRDQLGRPIEGAYVGIRDALDNGLLASTSTDRDGVS